MGLNNSQFQTLLREYEQQQLNNRTLMATRYEEVCNKLPEYPKLEDDIATISIQYGRKILEGNQDALSEYKYKLAILKAEKEKLLLLGGFPIDYFDPVFRCQDCQDTGFINNAKCHCFKNASIRLLYKQSNLEEVLEQENFDTYSFDFYSKEDVYENTGFSVRDINQDVVSKCKAFVHNFRQEFQNIYLYGNTGVGKTFLLNCIAKELIDKEQSVLYFTATDFFDILIKSAFDKYDVDSNSIRELIFNCDLLIIDDLGTEYINNAVTSQLFICINHRLQNNKSVVISSNLSPNKLADTYTERIGSRVVGNYLTLRLVGSDIRIHKK